MTKVISTKTVDFPKFGWGIHAGEERDAPEDKEAQKVILAHPAIEKVGEKKDATKDITSKED